MAFLSARMRRAAVPCEHEGRTARKSTVERTSAQLVALDFTGGRFRQRVDELDPARTFVVGEPAAHVRDQFFGERRRRRARAPTIAFGLISLSASSAPTTATSIDGRMREQRVFHFHRRHVDAADFQQIVAASAVHQVP